MKKRKIKVLEIETFEFFKKIIVNFVMVKECIWISR